IEVFSRVAANGVAQAARPGGLVGAERLASLMTTDPPAPGPSQPSHRFNHPGPGCRVRPTRRISMRSTVLRSVSPSPTPDSPGHFCTPGDAQGRHTVRVTRSLDKYAAKRRFTRTPEPAPQAQRS